MENETQISESQLMQVVLTIVALILPPISILPKVGLGVHFWFNLILTLFCWVPGLIHALWIIWTPTKEQI